MDLTTRRSPVGRAFTLIELIAVIIVLAILAGIAIPKYIDYAAQAKSSSVKGTLGAVRSAIANYYSNSAVNGAAAFPAIGTMQTFGVGGVMQEVIPANPYVNDASIAAATWNVAPPVSGTNGWNYDAATGKFWANSNTVGENAW